MIVQLIGELNQKSASFPNSSFYINHIEYSNDAYYIFFYNQGKNDIFIYKFTLKQACDIKTDSLLSEASHKHTGLLLSGDYELIYLTSINLQFPVYFLIHSEQKVWAIGHDESVDLKPYLTEIIKSKTCSRKRKASEAILTNSTEVPNSLKTSSAFKCVAPIIVGKSKNLIASGPICSVEKVLEKCLLFCRINVVRGYWCIEAFMHDGKSVLLSQVPFQSSATKYLGKQAFCDPGSDSHVKDQKLVLKFVQAEGMDNFISDTCTLKTTSFLSFFGVETLLISRAVILFGTSSGQILWQPLVFEGQNLSISASRDHVLCDIEQPVKNIHVCSENPGKLGMAHDSIVILGTFGKVVFLSPKTCEMHKEKEKAFQVFVSYIPTPVHHHVMINTSIYHTSVNGELWTSDLSRNADGCCCKCRVYQSNPTGCCGVKQLENLLGHDELILFETFDGYLYLGQLLKDKRSVNSNLCFSKQFPHLLETGYQVSGHLYQLETVESKQKKLLSLLSNLSSLKGYSAWKENISCTIQEIGNRKIVISLSLSIFKRLRIEPSLCYLSASISRCFKRKSICCKKHWLYDRDFEIVTWEIDSTIWPFCVFLSLPWMLEIGLSFDIPKDWKQLQYFQMIEDIPQYFKIKTFVIHEFLFLRPKAELSFHAVPQLPENNAFLFIDELYNRKLTSTFKRLKVRGHLKLSPVLSSCAVQLSNSTAEIFKKMKEPLRSCCSFEYFTHQCIPVEASTDWQVKCFGYPVKLSVIQNERFHILKIDTADFKVLLGLKFALMHLIMASDANQNVPLLRFRRTENVSQKIEVLSWKIHKLLCEDESLLKLRNEENLLDIYKTLRNEISSKLFL